MYKILIADDEVKICEAAHDYLSAKGLSVKCAYNGNQAIELCENEDFDLIILDVMMPYMDGIEACREIREITDAPIMFLSALSEERDLLKGYKNGADDYITKPFPLSVLHQKILTMIRRSKGADADNKISLGAISIDLSCRRAFSLSKEIRLSSKDFELLSYLMQNRGIVLSREIILTKIWGYDYDGDTRVVDTHIKRIRKALGDSAEQIKTVVGIGYSIEEV